MNRIIVRLKIFKVLLFSKGNLAQVLHKATNGRIMDHYKMSDLELLKKLHT